MVDGEAGGTPPTTGAGPDPAARRRLDWVDVARGAAILLIVELHTQGALRLLGVDHPALVSVNVALATVRLPTFFLVSGLLAGSMLDAPARTFLRRRPITFIYLYLLWGAVLLAVEAVLAAAVNGSATAGVPAAAGVSAAQVSLQELLVADSVLWYLLALAVFHTAARASRRIPVPLQFAAAIMLAALTATDLLPAVSWGVDHMLSCYLYFLIGRHLRPAVTGFAARATTRRCLLLGAAWLVAGGLLRLADPSGRALIALLPLVALPLAISLAAVVAGHAGGAPLRTIGRHTLPIYVLHPVVIAGLTAAVGQLPTGHRSATGSSPPLAGLPLAAQAGLVLAATAVVGATSWLAWRGLRRIPGLFDLPVPRPATTSRSAV